MNINKRESNHSTILKREKHLQFEEFQLECLLES